MGNVKRLIAIGDIHGHNKPLKQLLQMVNPSHIDDKFIFMGDYIDRGPASKDVIDTLIEFARYHDCVFLQGNHEAMFGSFLGWNHDYYRSDFYRNGGRATLESYIVSGTNIDTEEDVLNSIPGNHIKFLQDLLPYYETDDFVFVHAGLNPPSSDPKYTSEFDRLWIREAFLKHTEPWGNKIIVHGHTASPGYVDFKSNRINLDSGAAYAYSLSACDVLTGDTWSTRISPIGICKYKELGCNHDKVCTKHLSKEITDCGYYKYFEFLEEEY